MAYWLVKSEPSVYSFDQLIKEKKVVWDGIRNYAARNNLRAMMKGDKALYYHSNEGMEIVGIAEITKTAFQDPTTDNPNWLAVELKPVKKLKKNVSLSEIKKDVRLQNMDLVRLGRLSTQQVRPEEWDIVMEMAGEKK
jgi:predicted RNA-binding protein with PUA-like domain